VAMTDLQTFRDALGNPSYEDDDVLLYHGDAFALLEMIPADSIPLTITSPPYNIGKEYEVVKGIREYVEWTSEWTRKIHRVTTRNGAFWLNLGYVPLAGKGKAIPIPYLIWDRVPFYMIQEIVWNYGAGVAGRLFFSPRNEKFLWFVKDETDYVFNLDEVRDPNVKYPNQKKNGKLKCNPNGKNPSDVRQIAKVTSGRDRSSKERTAHPAQFPIELLNRIILASSNPGDLILDPFVGSGSSLEAAIRTGRKAIGFEINIDYIKVAATRIRQFREGLAAARAQASLFDSEIAFDRDKLQTR
jgi:adenine-specific DNA-methyltransferase